MSNVSLSPLCIFMCLTQHELIWRGKVFSSFYSAFVGILKKVFSSPLNFFMNFIFAAFRKQIQTFYENKLWTFSASFYNYNSVQVYTEPWRIIQQLCNDYYRSATPCVCRLMVISKRYILLNNFFFFLYPFTRMSM